MHNISNMKKALVHMNISYSKDTFFDKFCAAFSANGAALLPFCTREVSDLFFALTERMLEVNRTMNLTAITEVEEILVKHYADCALAAPLFAEGARVCDVGTGGGFPSLPLAILRPDLSITAVDSTAKKLTYVAETARLLSLDNLRTVTARAEALGADPLYREKFDAVTARAVAPLNILAEWCLPLVSRGGHMIALKGRGGEEELSHAAHAIDVLGGVTQQVLTPILCNQFSAPSEAEGSDADAMRRCLIVIKKRQFTPKQYPRANTQITKKPL